MTRADVTDAPADGVEPSPVPAGPGLATRLVAHAYVPPPGFAAPQPPVHKASTVFFADTRALRARNAPGVRTWTYGLHGTPTTCMLEARIATLDGGTASLLVPSGLAAITLVDTALLAAGDHVLLPDNVYGPSREFTRQELKRWGITHGGYDPMRPASLAAALTPATRLVWLEAPGSLTMEFPDLAALVAAARAAAGVHVAIDHTWGSGIAYDPFAIRVHDGTTVAVDVAVHALTKYPSGGGDVLMGSVTTRDAALHDRLAATQARLGFGVGGNDAEAVLRALPSLPLRYHAQDAAGRRLAGWWRSRPEVQAVLHPALEGAPGNANWRAIASAAAGLFSVVFRDDIPAARVDAFVDALKLFRIGFSWAGPVSLAVPYDLRAIRPGSPWRGTLVRFSLGLEDVDDLIADCAQALDVAAR